MSTIPEAAEAGPEPKARPSGAGLLLITACHFLLIDNWTGSKQAFSRKRVSDNHPWEGIGRKFPFEMGPRLSCSLSRNVLGLLGSSKTHMPSHFVPPGLCPLIIMPITGLPTWGGLCFVSCPAQLLPFFQDPTQIPPPWRSPSSTSACV